MPGDCEGPLGHHRPHRVPGLLPAHKHHCDKYAHPGWSFSGISTHWRQPVSTWWGTRTTAQLASDRTMPLLAAQMVVFYLRQPLIT